MLVSIVTPTFNRELFLAEAIESVLSQTISDFELIIVDDGSTDNTRELVDGYIKKDSRVKYFYQPNQGQSTARNLAISKAIGQYICFLDSDNYWPANKLEKCLDAFKAHPDVDIVYGDIVAINESGQILSYDNIRRYSGKITKYLLRDNCVSMNTTMTRRKCFEEMGGMSGNRRVADDYDLWIKFSVNYKFFYIPEYLAFYRVMENQISSNKKLRFEVNEKIVSDFLATYPEVVSPSDKRVGFSATAERRARYLASVGKKREALGFVYKAVKHSPLHLNSWRTFLKVLLS